MTSSAPTAQSRRTIGLVPDRAFAIHYLQMLAAMGIGMLVFGMAASAVLPARGFGLEVDLLLMATWMTAGMATWMAWRRHPVRQTVEMSLAMYLTFAVLFPFHWAGLLSGGALSTAGHILMLPTMALVMRRAAG